MIRLSVLHSSLGFLVTLQAFPNGKKTLLSRAILGREDFRVFLSN